MALHGLIQVNGQTIGGWSATRRESPQPGGAFVYDCNVEMLPTATYPASRQTFTIKHEYDAGAMALAAAVLGEAAS